MKIIIFLMVLCFGASFARGEQYKEQNISIGVSLWAPYIQENGIGIALDKLANILKYSNLSYSVRYYPFKRLLWQTTHNHIQVAAILTQTPSRKRLLLFSDPIFCDRRFIYSLENRRGNDLSEIEGETLGVGLGINYGKGFEKEVENFHIKVQRFPTPQVLLLALLENRVKNVLISEREANSIMKRSSSLKVVAVNKANEAYSEMELHFALPVSKDGERLLGLINDAIVALDLQESCSSR